MFSKLGDTTYLRFSFYSPAYLTKCFVILSWEIKCLAEWMWLKFRTQNILHSGLSVRSMVQNILQCALLLTLSSLHVLAMHSCFNSTNSVRHKRHFMYNAFVKSTRWRTTKNGAQIFFSPKQSRPDKSLNQPPNQISSLGLYPGLKRPAREIDFSHKSNVGVRYVALHLVSCSSWQLLI